MELKTFYQMFIKLSVNKTAQKSMDKEEQERVTKCSAEVMSITKGFMEELNWGIDLKTATMHFACLIKSWLLMPKKDASMR